MAQKCVIKYQERKSHYVEYKEILESTISLNSWTESQQTCVVFPRESGKVTPVFFCLELQLVICSMAQSGSDCSAVTDRWMLKQGICWKDCGVTAFIKQSWMAV